MVATQYHGASLMAHAEREADRLSHLVKGKKTHEVAYELRKTLAELRSDVVGELEPRVGDLLSVLTDDDGLCVLCRVNGHSSDCDIGIFEWWFLGGAS